MGLKIARWLIGATLLYVLIFWLILSNSEASLASVITLCLHLALYPLHQRQPAAPFEVEDGLIFA